MAGRLDQFAHPVWRAAAATAAGYGVVLLVLCLLLFFLPTLVVSAW